MNKKLMILLFFVCFWQASYAMLFRADPSNYSKYNPRLEDKVDVSKSSLVSSKSLKSLQSQKIQNIVDASLQSDQSSSKQSLDHFTTEKPLGVARGIFGANPFQESPVVGERSGIDLNQKKQSVQSPEMQQFSAQIGKMLYDRKYNKSKKQPSSTALIVRPEPLSFSIRQKDEPVGDVNQEKQSTERSEKQTELSSTVSSEGFAQEKATESTAVTNNSDVTRPKPSFLGEMMKRNKGLKKTETNTAQNGQSEESLVFSSKGDYIVALAKVKDNAEKKALIPIQEQADKNFDEKWPLIKEKYISDRQGLEIKQDRLVGLENKTKASIYKEILAKNQQSVDQAIKQAEDHFKSKARVVEIKHSTTKSNGVNQADLVSKQNINDIKSAAENKMRYEILNKIFTSKDESIWKEDFALDYERSNYRQASKEIIDRSWNTYKNIEANRLLTVDDQLAITQAGQKAVEDFKAAQAKAPEKESQKKSLEKTNESMNPLGKSESPVTVVVEDLPQSVLAKDINLKPSQLTKPLTNQQKLKLLQSTQRMDELLLKQEKDPSGQRSKDLSSAINNRSKQINNLKQRINKSLIREDQFTVSNKSDQPTVSEDMFN